MANTESLEHPASDAQLPAIEILGRHELREAQELVAESGWNQRPADWSVFIARGTVFKVTDPHAGLVATAAILPYAPRFGWISMVLVRKSHRRMGLATRLLTHCISQLQQQGLVPVLDATPAGRTVYRPLGFEDGWSISRWRRPAESAGTSPADDGKAVRPIRDSDWPALLALDAPVFGADRGELLRSLAERSRAFACVVERDGHPTGFLLGRDGRQATQVGPIIAGTQADARALLAHALARIEGPVLLDVVEGHPAFSVCLPPAGFSVERGYVRMALGASPRDLGSAARTVAIAGPELG